MTKKVLIDRDVRQGCPLSPTLFNIYIHTVCMYAYRQMTKQEVIRITVLHNKQLTVLLNSNYQIKKRNVQTLVYKLIQITKDYNFTKLTQK